ncbi:MAG: flagellar hook-basal body complex protein FliE [Bacillota bacterium]|jgi:flagellar hook-basal body complex protein FliE|nr:flagellar hook-basal body complex protein FliE [Clostridia bacterium]
MIELIPVKPIDHLPQLKNIELGNKLKDDGKSFTAFLQDALNTLEKIQEEGNAASLALITGEVDNLHTPVIALEKANLSLSLAVTVRNKVINAYQEIMRMQI